MLPRYENMLGKMDFDQCKSCREPHRKIKVYPTTRKKSINISHIRKALGPSSESWFDDISKEKIDKKDDVSTKLYGKVAIETDVTSSTPSTRDDRSIYASTPGHCQLTPMSAWAKVNSEESGLSSPITYVENLKDNSLNEPPSCMKDKIIPYHVRQMVNQDLNMTWSSSMATPKANIDQSSQESTLCNSVDSVIKNKGFPRVLFSPGPTHIDNDELGFHLNSTVEEDRTLLRSSQPCVSVNSNHDVKRTSQEAIREFSQEKQNQNSKTFGKTESDKLLHPALLELSCDEFDTGLDKSQHSPISSHSVETKTEVAVESSVHYVDGKLKHSDKITFNSPKNDSMIINQNIKREPSEDDTFSVADSLTPIVETKKQDLSKNAVLSVLSEFFDTPKTSSRISRKRKVSDGLDSNPCSQSLTPSILKRTNSNTDGNRKRVRFDESTMPSLRSDSASKLIIQEQLSDLIGKIEVSDVKNMRINAKNERKSSVEELSTLEKHSIDQKSKTSPPITSGHPDELFSQISPSSLQAMCVSPKNSIKKASSINLEELNVKKEDMSVENCTVDEKELSKNSGPSISECDSKSNECGGQKEKISKLSIKSKARRFLYPSLNQITKSSPQSVYGFDTKSKSATAEVKIKTEKNDIKLEDKKESIQSSSLEMKIETVSSTDMVKCSDIKPVGKEVTNSKNRANTSDRASTALDISKDTKTNTSPETRNSFFLSQKTKTAIDNLCNDLENEFLDEMEMSQIPRKSTIKELQNSKNILDNLGGFSTAKGKSLAVNKISVEKAQTLLAENNLEPIPTFGESKNNSSFVHIDGPVSFKRVSVPPQNAIDDFENQLDDLISSKKGSIQNQNSSKLNGNESQNQTSYETSSKDIGFPLNSAFKSVPSHDSYPSAVLKSVNLDGLSADSYAEDMESVLSDLINLKQKTLSSRSEGRCKESLNNNTVLSEPSFKCGFATASGHMIQLNPSRVKPSNSIIDDFTKELSTSFEAPSTESEMSFSETSNLNINNSSSASKTPHSNITSKQAPIRHKGFNPFKAPKIIKKISENTPCALEESKVQKTTSCKLLPPKQIPSSNGFISNQTSSDEEGFDTQVSIMMIQELDSQYNVGSEISTIEEKMDQNQISSQENTVNVLSRCAKKDSKLEENVKSFFKMNKLSKLCKERNSQNSQNCQSSQDLNFDTPPLIGPALKLNNGGRKIFLSEEFSKDKINTKYQSPNSSQTDVQLNETAERKQIPPFHDNQCLLSTTAGFQTASGCNVVVKESSLKHVQKLLEEVTKSPENLSLSTQMHACVTEANSTTNLEVMQSDRDKPMETGASSHAGHPMFQTARGTSVNVKETSLQSVSNRFDSDGNLKSENSVLRGTGKQIFPMFQTASGKSVDVKEESRQHIKEMLDFDDFTKIPHSFELESSKFTGRIGEEDYDSKVEQSVPNNPNSDICFLGFQTASVKSIDATEDAKSHAQTFVHTESNDTNFGIGDAKFCVESNIPGFNSENVFQTASGKNVSVSDKSLQNVRKLFTEEPSFLPVPKTNNLFQTASGKSVNVSAKSLQLVSEFFNEEHSKVPDSKPDSYTYSKNVSVSAISDKCLSTFSEATPTCNSQINNFFQTASGKNVSVSAKSVESVSGIFNEKPLPLSNYKMDNLFQTASGKNVSVSAKSLQSVSNIFIEDASERDSKTNNLFKTASGKNVKVSSESLRSVSNLFIEDASIEGDSKTNSLFQTASGKNVNVSAKSLENVSHIFNEESKTKNVFQTASEKNVSVSAKSVENVSDIFDKESPLVPDSKTNSLFQTASGKNVNVSAKSVQDMSDIFNEQPHLVPCSNRNNLFQTASGKKVSVSSKSLQNVSHILEESSSLVPNLESIQTPVDNSSVESCRRESVTLQTPGMRNVDSLKTNDEKLQTTPVSRYNHNNSRKSLDLVSNDKRRPVYSRPEQRYFDRRPTDGRHFSPLESKTLQQSKASYEDQLENLLVPQRQQDKSKFITPYKKTTPSSTVSSSSETQNHKINKSNPFIAKRSLKLGTSTITKSQLLVENSLETESNSISDSIIATKNEDTNINRDDFMCHIEAARMQQDKIIRCKKKQKVRPLPGQLSCMKGERSESKIHYEQLSRQNLNRRELIKQGCLQSTLDIRSTSAEDHRFKLADFYPNLNTDILVGDGAKLVADNHGFAGKEEFYRSFLTMEGVDIGLITEEWLYNHYRWIVWKLAAYEVTLSSHFAGRCLTPNNVMLQLKYRYDKEIDQCQRSAIKKIVERDDTACKRMVLCICDINKSVTDTSVQLTDSWYSIWACLDIPLLDLINKQKLVIGQKIIVTGAELVGSQDACSPLDIPESLKLKLCYNFTRPASWCSKLGFQCDPRPLCVPLSTLHSEGGNIGSIDVIVSRVYPMMYMEKMPDGGCVFRTSDMEERVSRHNERRKQELMEKMYCKLEKQLECSEQSNMCRRRSNKRWKKSEIDELTNGQDILEAVENSLQPEEIHSWLSNHQIDEMRDYQQQQHDDKQRRLQQEIQQSLSDNQQSTLERKVTPLLKIRLIGCSRRDIDNKAATILTVWRPSPEWCQLQESKRYKLYNLQASFSKSRLESLPVHVTSTRQSRIQHLHIDENLLDVIYDPREVWRIKDLKARQPAFKEFDFVGLVFDVENGRQGTMQIVHCVDFDGGFLNITFWNGLKNFGVEDVLIVGKCFVACNLILKSHYGNNIIQADVLQEVTQISKSSKLPLHRKCLEKFTTLKQEEKITMLETSIKRYQDRHIKKTVAKTPEKMYTDLPVDLEQFFSPMAEGDTSFENQDDVSQKDVEQSKRKALIRKKTSKLLAYGSPSPLSQLNCSISPAAAKAFRVPVIKKAK